MAAVIASCSLEKIHIGRSRAAVFLTVNGDEAVNAQTRFCELNEKDRDILQIAFEDWVLGRQFRNQQWRFFRPTPGINVLEWRHHRFYGFIATPDRVVRNYGLYVVVAYVAQRKWKADNEIIQLCGEKQFKLRSQIEKQFKEMKR